MIDINQFGNLILRQNSFIIINYFNNTEGIMDYSKTVNLPQTEFSMKANLIQKEPEMIKRWEKIGLYKKQLEKREGKEEFILHDGPPYANGEIHCGTALNKVLKDILNKYKFLRGYKAPYVPGWDCHGLPIELKVVESLGEKAHSIDPVELRKHCRKYAEKYVKIQMDAFKRLGVIGDFENPYLTMSKEYEIAIVEAFGELVKNGYIYRGMKPVYWCISCGTSLAEAEIEYHDHTSPSIFVKFPVVKHNVTELKNKKVFVLIWTTTPWTLPANTGLSFHPEESYVATNVEGEYLIVAEKLLNSVVSIKGITNPEVIKLTKKDLEEMKVNHPWIERESKIVFGLHVTMDTGTGIVHTAPGHGIEDYVIGLEYGLEQLSPVRDDGTFDESVENFSGMNVFDANEKIISFLSEKGLLYEREDISHSYPHCWRCKNPIIFRSKPQWFFRVSDSSLSSLALKYIEEIKWVPEWGKQRIKNMLEDRPDWCLSRQRHWGVPIIAFYCEDCGEAIVDKKLIDNVVNIMKKDGVDVWYQKEAKDLLPEGTTCPKCGGKKFRKEKDILDVWFDSGVSHYAVLDKRPELRSPADVYLEGNDQYRGWFQSSLWPSLAIKKNAPYKTIITHGWVLDEQGRQMHKSLGNAVAPKEIYDKYGADIFRIWVVSEDYRDDLRIGENMIQKCVDMYRKIRNTFRYLLGNLHNFDKSKMLEYNNLIPVDKFILAKFYQLSKNVEKFYDEYEFYRAFREIYNFCSVDLSSFYLDVLKDRLYIYPLNSRERLSAQTVLYNLLERMMIMLSPVLSFTMEEVYKTFFSKNEEDSVHLLDWLSPLEEWNNSRLFSDFEKIMEIRDDVLKAIEFLRSGKKGEPIGSSLESKIIIMPKNDNIKKILDTYKSDLRFIFIVSGVEIVSSLDNPMIENEEWNVSSDYADGKKCARCWNYSTEVGNYSDHPELCERCYPIVKEIDKN